MRGFQKRLLTLSAALALGAGVATAQPAAEPAPTPSDAERLEQLYADLAQPERDDWERIEGEIGRLWSKSGSDSMDLLLQRGQEALEAEDYPAALDHFGALTDHAPDFAEGWNGRATAFYLMGEFTLAISDVEHVLALNPRHFGALQGLAFMFEQMGEDQLALKALKAVHSLNPNRPDINDAIERLERLDGAAEL